VVMWRRCAAAGRAERAALPDAVRLRHAVLLTTWRCAADLSPNTPAIPLQLAGPSVSLYLTLFGIIVGIFSTFWACCCF
jgi:hypothetical protein